MSEPEYVPSELVTDILLRLPVRDILKFRVVSKTWRAIIDCPEFVKRQVQRSIVTGSNRAEFISFNCQNLHRIRGDVQSPLSFLPGSKVPGSIMGSCNGLICSCLNSGQDLLVFNPKTGKQYEVKGFIPEGFFDSSSGPDIEISTSGEGFGYDSVSDDYKAVRISALWTYENGLVESQIAIHSLRQKSCKLLRMSLHITNARMGFLYRNMLLWPGEYARNSFRFVFIVAIDLETDQVYELPQPEYEDGAEPVNISIGTIDSCFCLCAFYESPLTILDVWLMKEFRVKESWSKLYSIPNDGTCYPLMIPLRNPKLGEPILFLVHHSSFYWCDPVTGSLTLAEMDGEMGGQHIFFEAIDFWESLARPFLQDGCFI